MKRTAIDAAAFLACLVGILSLLWIPTPAFPSDDHGMKEVEALAGAPSDFKHDLCGGSTDQYGERIEKWACTMWMYPPDKDGDRIVVFFDRKTGLVVGLGYLYSNGNSSGPAEKDRMREALHRKLHEARGTPIKNSSAKKGHDT